MAHFAKIENDTVVHVSVVDNVNAPDEETGVAYLRSIHGENTVWKKTSYNSNIRKNFAGVGYFYDEIKDAFIAPKPYPSWVLNEQTCKWEPTITKPNTGDYIWDEENLKWIKITM